MKAESNVNYNQYISVNEYLFAKLKETTEVVALKIHESGLYQEPEAPKELVSTFKPNFSESKL